MRSSALRMLLVMLPALILTGCVVQRNPYLDFRLAVRAATVDDGGQERALIMSGDTVRDDGLEVVVWGAPMGFVLTFNASTHTPLRVKWDDAYLVGPGGGARAIDVSDEARVTTVASGSHGMRLIGRIYGQDVSVGEPTVALLHPSESPRMRVFFDLSNVTCLDILRRSIDLIIPVAWGDDVREYRIFTQPGWFFFDVPGDATRRLHCGPVPSDIR